VRQVRTEEADAPVAHAQMPVRRRHHMPERARWLVQPTAEIGDPGTGIVPRQHEWRELRPGFRSSILLRPETDNSQYGKC